jgi:hypothetical protein
VLSSVAVVCEAATENKIYKKIAVVSHDMTSLMCPVLNTEEACCSNVFGLHLSLMMIQQSQHNGAQSNRISVEQLIIAGC